MSTLTIVVNGKETQTTEGATLFALLRKNGIGENTEGVAVAVNSTVIPRRQWDELRLLGGDVVEVIHAVQGG